MKVTQVEVEFGMTQNLGDYTNTRPSVKLVAELAEGDDPDQVLSDLRHYANGVVHNIVDDELELAGRQVKYFRGPLFRVWHSKLRECVIIALPSQMPPQEENWKHRDNWNSYIPEREFPTHMRWETAQEAARLVQAPGWGIYDCSDGDFSIIPLLPDAGPEPLWHQKGLRVDLNHMHIDEEHWEELAALDHVTVEYLQDVRREHGWGTSAETFIAFIRENKPFTFNLKEEDENDEDDEDWDDDDE